MSSMLHNINGVIIFIKELVSKYEDSSPKDNEISAGV